VNLQLATAVRGDPADNVTESVVAAPVVPVFVDASGRRRKLMTGVGWLVALACVTYLAVIGVSLSGTSVGPLPELPSVASRTVVFSSDAADLPQGALEAAPLPAPAAPAAAAPNFGNAAKVAVARGTAAAAAPKVTPKIAPKTAPKAAPKAAPKTTPKTTTKTTTKVVSSSKSRTGAALSTNRTATSARTGGASR
jgi:hypothetical protein